MTVINQPSKVDVSVIFCSIKRNSSMSSFCYFVARNKLQCSSLSIVNDENKLYIFVFLTHNK